MSLEDDLKNQTLAAVAQGIDQWQSDLRRALTQHEETVARSLDSLQRAAAFDLGSLEPGLATAIGGAIADQPAAVAVTVPAAFDFGPLRGAMAAIDNARTLSDAMTTLVNEAQQFAERAVMLIVKGSSAIGWYGRGAGTEAVKLINVPVDDAGAVATVIRTKQPLHGAADGAPWARLSLGGAPAGAHAVPLVLRDKVSAVLYTDSSRPTTATERACVEILAQYAARVIDVITVQRAAKVATGATSVRPAAGANPSGPVAVRPAPVSAPVVRPASGPLKVQVAAPLSGAVPIIRDVPAPPPPPTYVSVPAPQPFPITVEPEPLPPVVEITDEDGANTVVFDSSVVAAATVPQVMVPVVTSSLSDAEQKAHDQAKRFARLVVSEIKLYNESKVTEGRRHRDLYERLKEDIERGRQVYTERVPADIRESTNYFYDELVRVLAAGDATALGPM